MQSLANGQRARGNKMQHDEMQMVAVRCRLQLREMGVDLKVKQDLDEVVDLFSMLDKKPSKANDPSRLLLTKNNSFSIFGFEAGEPVFGFMVRVDDLGDEDAQSFLKRSVETIFDVRVTRTLSNLYVGRQWGRAAYFGDLKTKRRKGIGPKGDRIIRLATGFAHFHAMDHFGSLMNYCFLRVTDIRNGVPYGFLENDAYVWETDRDLYPDGSPAVIAQLSRQRLASTMFCASMLLPDLLTVDQQPRLEVISKNTASRP